MNSMEQRLSKKANRSSASQKFPLILWSPMVHSRIHKRRSPVPILREINTVHASRFHSLKMLCYFNRLLYFLLSVSPYPKNYEQIVCV
jgi:hypothetical protein